MPPRLSVQNALLPGTTPAEWFAHAAEFGYDGVELNHNGDSLDVRAAFDAIAAASESSDVSVAAICTTGKQDPVFPDQEERNNRVSQLIELVDAASALDAAGVISVPIRPAAKFDQAPLPDLAIEIYQRTCENFGDGDAALFLEPLNRYEARFLNRVGQAVMLARMIEHPRIKALADLFHMNIEETSLSTPIEHAGALLGHVHVADNTRDEPGAGMLDMTPLFGALKSIDYDGWVSLECRGLSDVPEAALSASATYLRRMWDEA